MSRYCFFTERQVGIGSAAAAVEPYLRENPEVTWVDVTYTREGGWLERLPRNLTQRLGRATGTLRGVLQTREGLQQGPYDALFFLTHNPAVFRQLTLRRVPSVLWTDVTPALLDQQAEQYAHPVDKSALARVVKDTLVQSTFRSAALCVGWSEWARRSFVTDYGVPEQCTEVVPPGVDLLRFTARATTINSDALPRLLFVGGDFARKGGDLLLEVFRESLQGKAELDIVTRDPVPNTPGVRVHHGLNAKSPELLALYRNAAAFVLPTRGDCYSIASLEAMAMGLPVIVTDVGGISDIVERERSGFLIQPNDARDLRTALEAVLVSAERRRALGQRGREIVEQRFDARKTADRLLELVRSAPERRARRGH
ncbi:MAG TPA: glycosyltransferase family 4 protein [Polyangiaceae bacterium]|nr:glycosyltransferase family 4 protein [Polyangiaceae bacterium]